MKNLLSRLAITMVLIALAIPVHASCLQNWACELEDDKTPADARAVSAAWTKAANSMESGAELGVLLVISCGG